MMKSEFIEKTGFEPTGKEYEEIEAEYMGTDVDKDLFCKEWKKNGGIQRLMRLRARRIEELESEVEIKERQYNEMDVQHCNEFLQMKKNLDGKLNEAAVAYEQCHEANLNLDRLLQEAKAAKKEAEDKLETVRAALAILGIGKEVV